MVKSERKIPRKFLPLIRNKKGAIALTAAVLMMVFLGFAALAIDVGYVFTVKAQLQNAADAAALAGAKELPDQTLAQTKAQEYVGYNGDGTETVNVTFPGTETDQIEVQVIKTVPYFFAKIFGKDDIQLTANARALFSQQLEVWGVYAAEQIEAIGDWFSPCILDVDSYDSSNADYNPNSADSAGIWCDGDIYLGGAWIIGNVHARDHFDLFSGNSSIRRHSGREDGNLWIDGSDHAGNNDINMHGPAHIEGNVHKKSETTIYMFGDCHIDGEITDDYDCQPKSFGWNSDWDFPVDYSCPGGPHIEFTANNQTINVDPGNYGEVRPSGFGSYTGCKLELLGPGTYSFKKLNPKSGTEITVIFTGGGDYTLDIWRIENYRSNNKIIFSPTEGVNVELRVEDIDIDYDSHLTLPSGEHYVKNIYTAGTLWNPESTSILLNLYNGPVTLNVQKFKAFLDTCTSDIKPSDLRVNCKYTFVLIGSEFSGLVYAPNAVVELFGGSRGSHFYGGLVCKRLELTSDSHFHADVAAVPPGLLPGSGVKLIASD